MRRWVTESVVGRYHLRLRELRKEHGLTQKELAAVLEIHPVTVSALERGRLPLSIPIENRIARYFNLDGEGRNYLLGNPRSVPPLPRRFGQRN